MQQRPSDSVFLDGQLMRRCFLIFTPFLVSAVPCEATPQGCTTSALWCYLPDGWPSFTVSCPKMKNTMPLTFSVEDKSGTFIPVRHGYSYSFTVNGLHSTGNVCDQGRGKTKTSCINYPLGRGPTCKIGVPKYPPHFCNQCVKNGGVCSTLANRYKACVVK